MDRSTEELTEKLEFYKKNCGMSLDEVIKGLEKRKQKLMRMNELKGDYYKYINEVNKKIDQFVNYAIEAKKEGLEKIEKMKSEYETINETDVNLISFYQENGIKPKFITPPDVSNIDNIFTQNLDDRLKKALKINDGPNIEIKKWNPQQQHSPKGLITRQYSKPWTYNK